MILTLKAPDNRDVRGSITNILLDNGMPIKLVDKLAQQLSSFCFLVVDAEISHLFPDYFQNHVLVGNKVVTKICDEVSNGNV